VIQKKDEEKEKKALPWHKLEDKLDKKRKEYLALKRKIKRRARAEHLRKYPDVNSYFLNPEFFDLNPENKGDLEYTKVLKLFYLVFYFCLKRGSCDFGTNDIRVFAEETNKDGNELIYLVNVKAKEANFLITKTLTRYVHKKSIFIKRHVDDYYILDVKELIDHFDYAVNKLLKDMTDKFTDIEKEKWVDKLKWSKEEKIKELIRILEERLV